MIRFALYSRTYCHLCDDMLAALNAYAGRYEFTVDVVDVDADESLTALYDEHVPVLVGIRESGEASEICHYFLDEGRLTAFLESR